MGVSAAHIPGSDQDNTDSSAIRDGVGGSNLAQVTAANALKTDGSAVTQPISATALPLPTGAATSALQTTGNTSLSSIDSKTPALVSGRQPVDGSGVTQPISAASLPLPTGASTSALQTTGNSSLSSIDTKLSTTNSSLASIDAGTPAALGQTTMANSMPVVLASNQTPLPISGTIATTGSPTGDLMSGYQPDPSDVVATPDGAKFQFDASNRLEIHGAGSDEGGASDDFPGSAFDIDWTATNSGTGSSTSVSSGRASLLPGTSNAGNAQIVRAGDYGPMTLQLWGKISQRIANQTSTFGFSDNIASPAIQAIVVFDGTVNTTVKFRTSASSSANETQETSVAIPNGGNTSADHLYKIDVSYNRCTLSIDGIVAARHDLHIPAQYDAMNIAVRISNAASVTATTLSFDKIQFNNWDRTQVDLDFNGEPLLTQTYVDPSVSSVSSVTRTEISQAASNGNAYTIVTSSLTASTAETKLIYITNSSSNSKSLYLANILLAVDVSSANWCNFQMYFNPTVSSNGTAVSIANLKAGSSNTSVMNVYSGPTSSANGTRVFFFPYNNSNQSGAVFPYNANPYIIISPGNSLLITGSAKANSTPVIIDLNWFEG